MPTWLKVVLAVLAVVIALVVAAGFLVVRAFESGQQAAERARVEGSTLIPVAELGNRLDEIVEHRSGPVVVHCHHGPRSRRACELLIENGFTQVEEMAGGIEAWSLTVDPSVPRY